ncbi:MAG: response regulator receiver [Gallionellaceae bacterium]|nr:MAG: response regulator receiver [Gallionellaceae bacterium]
MVNTSSFEQLKSGDRLPSLKGAAMEVFRLSQEENVSGLEVARAIKADPALSSRIVKASNSPASRQARPVVSVMDALTVLGLNTVRQLVVALSLVDSNRDGACKKFDYQAFWSQSLLTAIAAQKLVVRKGLGSPEEIFVLGLLGQIGALALATAYPQEYAQILEKTAANGGECADLAELENAEFGLDHNRLTKEMLADWRLPQVFYEAALHHENPAQSGVTEGCREWYLLHVLHVANYFARVCLAQEKQRREMVPKLIFKAVRMGVESEMLAELGDKVIQEWQEWGKMYGIRTEAMPPFAKLLEVAPLAPELLGAADTPRDSASYKLRILVIDDDRAVLLMLRMLLENTGHTVMVASNGKEALNMVEKHMPQLVLADWVMPEMDGIEFCKSLRQNQEWRNIYVFIMTAQESTERLVEAFEAGANDYMIKPINSRVLAARLGAAQRVVQLQEELEFDRQQLQKLAAELAASNERLQQLALTDALTGLPNRRSANEHLEQQWAMAGRSGRPLSIMIVDIDHFKKINDVYGHKVGDDALKRAAEAMHLSIRKQDVVCRLGGEEFLVICPDTPAEQLYRYAERLRLAVSEVVLHGPHDSGYKITVSIGLASKEPGLLNTEMLLQLADRRMYAAKHAGRNRTVAG